MMIAAAKTPRLFPVQQVFVARRAVMALGMASPSIDILCRIARQMRTGAYLLVNSEDVRAGIIGCTAAEIALKSCLALFPGAARRIPWSGRPVPIVVGAFERECRRWGIDTTTTPAEALVDEVTQLVADARRTCVEVFS